MSTQITTAFVNQFSQNIQLLSQQMGSLLRNSVRSGAEESQPPREYTNHGYPTR